MASASFGPAMFPQPYIGVWSGMKAFALSTMGRWRRAALKFGVRAGGQLGERRSTGARNVRSWHQTELLTGLATRPLLGGKAD